MRSTLKQFPMLVTTVRAMRALPGAGAVRRRYADWFTRRVFTNIYRENMWSDAESRSGGGSNLAATTVIRRELPALVRTLGVQTMLDVPCGDFHWMSTVDLGGVQYIGGDIVPDLIRANRERWGSPTRTFMELDAARQAVPRADLILCRDLFIHLSFAHIARVVQSFRASGSSWLAASTYADCTANEDALTGGCRTVNLQAAPFHFPEPSRLICEEPDAMSDGPGSKYLGVWRLSDLPH